MLEKTLESSLDSKEIKLVNPKGNQPWIFIGRTDAEAPILWPPDMKSPLTGKDPNAGKDWRQEVKGATEDDMVGWHYWLNVHEFEQSPGGGEGQGKLVCCSPWGHKKSDTTKWPNNNKRDLTSRTIHHMRTFKMHAPHTVRFFLCCPAQYTQYIEFSDTNIGEHMRTYFFKFSNIC